MLFSPPNIHNLGSNYPLTWSQISSWSHFSKLHGKVSSIIAEFCKFLSGHLWPVKLSPGQVAKSTDIQSKKWSPAPRAPKPWLCVYNWGWAYSAQGLALSWARPAGHIHPAQHLSLRSGLCSFSCQTERLSCLHFSVWMTLWESHATVF